MFYVSINAFRKGKTMNRYIGIALLVLMLCGGWARAELPYEKSPTSYWSTRYKVANGLRLFINLPEKVRKNDREIKWWVDPYLGDACHGAYKDEIALRVSVFWLQREGGWADFMNYQLQWRIKKNWSKKRGMLSPGNTFAPFDVSLSPGESVRIRMRKRYKDGRKGKWERIVIQHPCNDA